MQRLKDCIKVFLLLNILILLLFGVVKIPTSLVTKNCKQSVSVLNSEKQIYTLGDLAYCRDPNADAVALNIMMTNNSLLKSWYYGKEGNEKYLDLTNKYLETGNAEKISYYEYWHGYQILYKPLLIFMTIKQIRILYFVAYIIMLVYFLYSLYKMKDYFLLFAFLALNLLFITPSAFLSMEFIPVVLLMLLGSILVYKYDCYGIILANLGVVTVFLDFLTAETLTLAIPLLILAYKMRVSFIKGIKYCLYWCLSYIGTIFYKLILMSIIYKSNYVLKFINRYQNHFTTTPRDFKMWDMIIDNNFKVVGINYGIAVFITIVFITYIFRTKKMSFENLMLTVLLGLVPILRYTVLLDHSRYLFYFTYRALFATLFSELICLKGCVKIGVINKFITIFRKE